MYHHFRNTTSRHHFCSLFYQASNHIKHHLILRNYFFELTLINFSPRSLLSHYQANYYEWTIVESKNIQCEPLHHNRHFIWTNNAWITTIPMFGWLWKAKVIKHEIIWSTFFKPFENQVHCRWNQRNIRHKKWRQIIHMHWNVNVCITPPPSPNTSIQNSVTILKILESSF